MKKIAGLFFTLFVLFSRLDAKEFIDGYLISLNKDTIHCKIEVPNRSGGNFDLYFKVNILDSIGKTITYKAKKQEINGFGFIYDQKSYDYLLKTDDDGNNVFALKQVMGNKLNLYYFFYFSYAGSNHNIKVDSYILEDDSSRTIKVWSGFLSGYKRKIRTFLQDKPELVKLFGEMVLYFEDINDFVQEVNSRYK